MEKSVTHDDRRITLISRHPQVQEKKWDRSAGATSRIVLLDSFTVLRYALAGSLSTFEADIDRIVLDRSSSASDYLSLLAELPQEFAGDVLMIRDDETGFLSSTARGGDRILYALSAEDVRFYLVTHSLVEPGNAAITAAEDLRVLQFRTRAGVA